MSEILPLTWFQRDTSIVAEQLIGCQLCVRQDNGEILRCIISETEAYLGIRDKASHNYGGRHTARTEVMYRSGGHIYVYLIYGIHHMLNLITQTEREPEGVMLRAAFFEDAISKTDFKHLSGPGKLTKRLGISGRFKGKTLGVETGLWVENKILQPEVVREKRIGIDYADEAKDWLERYCWKDHPSLSR